MKNFANEGGDLNKGHEPTRLSSKALQFQELWTRSQNPSLELFVASNGPMSKEELCELIYLDMRSRWQRGDHVGVEYYMQRFPEVTQFEELVLEIAFCEYQLRLKYKMESGDNEFLLRFPGVVDKLPNQHEFDQPLDQIDESGSSVRSEDTWDAKSTPDEESIDGLFGRYEIREPLGRGGMGRVFLAYDTVLHRLVALKIPSSLVLNGALAIKRFYREGQASARLRHPNIASVYDAGVINEIHFLSMEYIEGITLAERLKQVGQIDPNQAIDWTMSMAKAIAYAHQNGIIHRDIKPANIILQVPDSNPVLTDFGLAQFHAVHSEGDTSSGNFCGTPAYASPEQIATDCELTDASDYYSLGVVFFQMLTGRLPFTGSAMSILRQVVVDPAPRPSSFNNNLSKQLDLICQRLLAKLPSERYASCDLLLEDLGRAQYRKSLIRTLATRHYEKKGQNQNHDVVRATRRVGIGLLIVALGLLVLLTLGNWTSVKMDADQLETGSRWEGLFSFDEKVFHPVTLEITSRDENNVKGIYRTEDKFEWAVSGTVAKDKVSFRFIETPNKGGADLLIKHGSLDCELRTNSISVRFSDSSDGSTTQFVLNRLVKLGN